MAQISNTVDTASLVSQLMAVERIPQDQLKQRLSALQTKQNAWNQIGSQISALQSASEALAPQGAVANLITASSTNDAAVGVRVTGLAAPSSSAIEVVNLATTHTYVSTDTFASTDATDGGRSLTLTVGSNSQTITSADGTIGGLAAAVNAANAGVKAKLVQTTPGSYQMVLTASASGASNAFTAAGSGWTGLTNTTAGADATLRVDGLTVKRSSNVVNDLISGVELTLKQPTVAPLQVAVTRDDNSVVTKVKSLVDTANNLIATVKRATATSATASARGAISGDSVANGLVDSLRGTIAAGITGTDGVVRSASTLGISLNRDGTIAFNEAKLRSSLASDPAAVAASIGRGGSSTIPGLTVSSVLSTASPGPHAISVTQIASASALVGVPIPPPPAGSTINMTVTTPTGTLTVTFNAGASYAATAANLTLALNRSGLSLEAASDGSSFSLVEKRSGSANTFSVNDGGAMGLTGTATPGTDAVATIDGQTVTGQGASISRNGVVLTVGLTAQQLAGGPVSGTYQTTDGLAGALTRLGGTSTTSTVSTATSSLASQLKDLQKRIDRYDDTLATKESLLKAKFTAMDTALTRMQGQLSQLASFVNGLG